MTDDETHHPRLLMLHESDGRIEGRAKYHKLLFNYVDEETEESSLDFVVEERGPYDPGLSQTMQQYEDLGLIEVDDDEEPHEIEETEKGQRYMSGYERAKERLDTAFQQTKERISSTVKRHGDKSANEMVERENVQKAKDNPMRKELE
ncbi:hypothetical protein [Halomicrococcus sp. NG-SE-24]|uniref:hypothetical protein n=1 Tax=Halomicrococcus sp. NG-SE-24 TaxID=3436928 RepID=UPI003D953588